MPVWMQKDKLPDWAQTRKDEWLKRGEPLRQEMLKALTEQKPAKKAAQAEPAAAEAE
jgi:hypothetical protein